MAALGARAAGRACFSQKSANHHRHAECEQTCKNQVLKRRRRKPRAQDLSYCHASNRGKAGDSARNEDAGIQRAVQAQAKRKGRREHKRRYGDRLNKLVLVTMNGLKIGSGGNDKYAGGAIQDSGEPSQRPVRARIRASHE